MPVAYGINGIRLRDWRVYLGFLADFEDIQSNFADMVGYLAVKDYENAKLSLDTMLAAMTHVGEMRKDSIEGSLADGDPVEGNEVGKVVMSKLGNFTAELINATPDNINAMDEIDGTEVLVVLEEIDGTVPREFFGASLEGHEIIMFGNTKLMTAGVHDTGIGNILSYAEKVSGGTISIGTFTLQKNVSTPAAFRKLLDVPYNAETMKETIVQGDTTPGNAKVTVNWTAPSDFTEIDAFLVECATSSRFGDTIVKSVETADGAAEDCEVTGLTNGVTYYFRVRSLVGGYPKSMYSNTKTGIPSA